MRRFRSGNLESSSSDNTAEVTDGAAAAQPTEMNDVVDNVDQTRASNGKRVGIGRDGESMYRAALQGDWVAAEILLARDPNLDHDYLTEDGDRALHVATAMKKKEFVEKLVEQMSEEDLTLVDGRGCTACCYAAISGVVEIARIMIEKHPYLVTVHDENNVTPLHKAALRGNKEMLRYLLKSTQVDDLSNEEWFDLLLVTIRGQMYDVGIEIMGKNGFIATMANEEGTALHLLARQEISNASMNSSQFLWEVLIDYINITEKELKFVELADKMWAEMQKLEKPRLLELIKKPSILHNAAKTGKVELVTMLTRAYPQLIWDTDSNGYTIFHIAVIYRQSDVFNLIHQVEAMIGSKTISQDQNGNNILHLAAKLPPCSRTKSAPSPQMQRELVWFKAVKEIVPPSCLMMKNKDGLTPREFFSKEHKRLLEKSEMWMRNTADSGMLIATILLTVVFTAAFTVPGGYGGQTGEPILAKRLWFKVFLVFEVLGLISSVISIVMFRSIMASRFAEEDFWFKLPGLQMAGFQALLLALAGAFSAFMSLISLFNLNMNVLVWFGFCSLYLFGSLWFLAEIGAIFRHNKPNEFIRSSRHNLFDRNPRKNKLYILTVSFLGSLRRKH